MVNPAATRPKARKPRIGPAFVIWVLIALAAAVAQEGKAEAAGEKSWGNRPKPVLAILPFNDANEKARLHGYGTTVSAMLVTEMRNHSNFQVLERSKIASLFSLQDMSAGMGANHKQIRALRESFGVEVVLTGDVSSLNGGIEVDARLVSTGTGEVTSASNGTIESDRNLRELVRALARSVEKKYLRQWMGSITVASQPVEAEVYLNGDFIGKAGAKAALRLEDLLEGVYRLELLAPGYRAWRDSVRVRPKEVMAINASLTALPGNLIVSSQPVAARVYLDGKAVGGSPLELKNISEGEHRLRLELESHYPWEEKVFVNSGQSSQVNAVLKIKQAFLDITSDPPAADVLLNGKFFGKTPLRIDKIEPGKVSLEIVKADYRRHTDAFHLKPDDSLKVKADLKLQTGLLTVVSDPGKVSVHRLGGKDPVALGQTPIIKETLNVGDYRLLLSREGHFPETLSVSVETDGETRVEGRLRKKPGHLHIATDPHTEVLLAGAFQGHTPIDTLDLGEGTYSVRLNSFHGSAESEVAIASDGRETLARSFRKSKTYLLGSLVFTVALGMFTLF